MGESLIVGTKGSIESELVYVKKALLQAKPQSFLSSANAMESNGVSIQHHEHQILWLMQKRQGTKIEIILLNTIDGLQRYLKQHICDTYLVSICQSEAIFDLSTSAQVPKPGHKNLWMINKRLQWQINNLPRGLNCIPLNFRSMELIVFTGGFLAYNKVLSSQLRLVIMLVNEEENNGFFMIDNNLIHWSSTKFKWVTSLVLAS